MAAIMPAGPGMCPCHADGLEIFKNLTHCSYRQRILLIIQCTPPWNFHIEMFMMDYSRLEPSPPKAEITLSIVEHTDMRTLII